MLCNNRNAKFVLTKFVRSDPRMSEPPHAKDLPVKGILQFCAACLLLAALLSQMSHALEVQGRLARSGSDGTKGHKVARADKGSKKE